MTTDDVHFIALLQMSNLGPNRLNDTSAVCTKNSRELVDINPIIFNLSENKSQHKLFKSACKLTFQSTGLTGQSGLDGRFEIKKCYEGLLALAVTLTSTSLPLGVGVGRAPTSILPCFSRRRAALCSAIEWDRGVEVSGDEILVNLADSGAWLL